MSAPMVISALGTRISIEAGDRPEPFSAAVEMLWAAARVRGGEPDATVTARSGGDDAAALTALQDDVVRTALRLVRPDVLVLRAVAVVDARGRVTLLLPGDGLALEAIARCLADVDCTVGAGLVGIDATGSVLPFRAPSGAIEPDGAGHADTTDRPRRSVRPLPATLRVARIVVVSPDAGPAEDSRGGIRIHDAADALVSASVNLASVPEPLRRISRLLEVCQLRVCGLCDIPVLVDERWSEPESPEATALLVREPAETRTDAMTDRPLPGGWYRGPVLRSGESTDGRRVVLRAENGSTAMVVLDEVQTDVWNRAGGAPRSELGPADVVAEMIALGLLSPEPAWRIDGRVAWVSEEQRTTAICAASPRDPVIALTGTAHVIWSVLADMRVATVGTLTEHCRDLFDIGSEELSRAIASLLAGLEARGAVVRA